MVRGGLLTSTLVRMVTEGTPTGEARSLGTLVNDLSEQTKRLVRAEVELAKAEMAEKAKRAGAGLGLLVGAGILAFYAVGVALTAAILGLAVPLPAWAAALIVLGAMLLLAGILVAVGVHLLKRASTKPETTLDSLKDDVAALKPTKGSTD